VLIERILVPGGAALAAAAGEAAPARTYRVLRTSEVDPYDPPLTPAEMAGLAIGLVRPAGDAFEGTARRDAKISISDAAIEDFDDLRDLIDMLPAHNKMKNHVPPISKGRNSKRVQEEHRNVRIRAFIYAASREDDNDFHLIVGRDPDLDPVYMTMELSGLPPQSSSHHDRLKETRNAYKDFFAGDIPGTSYDFYDPPIPMEVEGSLFFDMSHATGSRPGPASLRPDMPVVWEVHPISRIVFEP
jgi:hypothetical protein